MSVDVDVCFSGNATRDKIGRGGGGESEWDEQGMENKSAGPGVPERKTMVKIGICSRKSSGVHSTRKQPQANRQPVHYSNEKET
jgi:hypothetical protein